ncbi:hypothetical protein [Streptomyces sp. NPDC004629]|uniref:hypothetical protein n=1 Tax=Streptomyces sp. NPDC004629 TaxID=3364705 RepID=UPI0036B4AD5B
MTRRTRLLTTAAAGATAALLLAGCGGNDDDTTPNGKIAGADTTPTKTTSPTPTQPTPSNHPKITLPSDLTYTFDWPKTGDPDKDAVLSDSEQSIKAVDLAIVNQNALDDAYLYYYEGEAAAGTQKFIQNYVDHKASLTGAYRFYAPEVAVAKDGTASLTYCEDQGKAYVKYLDTNKVKKTEVTSKSYVIYHTSLKKNGKGVWTIQEINSQSGSAKCQP